MKQLRFKKGDTVVVRERYRDYPCTVKYVLSEDDAYDYILDDPSSPEYELLEYSDDELHPYWPGMVSFGRFQVGDKVCYFDEDVVVSGEVIELVGPWPEAYDSRYVDVRLFSGKVARVAVAALARNDVE